MFGVIKWVDDDNLVIPLTNEDGGVRLFESLAEADDYANERRDSDRLRVVSLEGVHE